MMRCFFDVYCELAHESEVCAIAARFDCTLEERGEGNPPGMPIYVELYFLCRDEPQWERAQEAIQAAGYHVEPGNRFTDEQWDAI